MPIGSVRLNLEVERSLVFEKALDVRYLEEVVSRFVEAPVAPSTRRTYLLGQRRYLIFVGGFSYHIFNRR